MKEFDFAKTKAMASKKNHKKFSFRIKWGKYEIFFLALPIAPFFIAWDRLNDWWYNKQEWNEQTAKKVLDYWLPYVLEWDEDWNGLYYSLEWHYYGYEIAKKVPFYLKAWANRYGFKLIHDYLQNSYEKDGYTKKVEVDIYNETYVYFKKKA